MSATTRTPLVTRKQILDAKEKGDIRGWFALPAKLPRGRPKKTSLLGNEDNDQDNGGQLATKLSLVLAPGESSTAPPKKKQRKSYDKWTTDVNMFARLRAAVINTCAAGNNKCNNGTPSALFMEQIPRTTIQRHMATFTVAAKQHSIPVCEVTCEMIVANRGGAHALLNAHDCRFLSDIAIS